MPCAGEEPITSFFPRISSRHPKRKARHHRSPSPQAKRQRTTGGAANTLVLSASTKSRKHKTKENSQLSPILKIESIKPTIFNGSKLINPSVTPLRGDNSLTSTRGASPTAPLHVLELFNPVKAPRSNWALEHTPRTTLPSTPLNPMTDLHSVPPLNTPPHTSFLEKKRKDFEMRSPLTEQLSNCQNSFFQLPTPSTLPRFKRRSVSGETPLRGNNKPSELEVGGGGPAVVRFPYQTRGLSHRNDSLESSITLIPSSQTQEWAILDDDEFMTSRISFGVSNAEHCVQLDLLTDFQEHVISSQSQYMTPQISPRRKSSFSASLVKINGASFDCVASSQAQERELHLSVTERRSFKKTNLPSQFHKSSDALQVLPPSSVLNLSLQRTPSDEMFPVAIEDNLLANDVSDTELHLMEKVDDTLLPLDNPREDDSATELESEGESTDVKIHERKASISSIIWTAKHSIMTQHFETQQSTGSLVSQQTSDSSLPDAVQDFRSMFDDGIGESYPADFPLSLRIN